MQNSLRITIRPEEVALIKLAASAAGLKPITYARTALLRAARADESALLTDWARIQNLIVDLLARSFNTVEDLALATGLKRDMIKAHLAVLVDEGRVREGFAPSRYKTVAPERDVIGENDEPPKPKRKRRDAKPRGTQLFFLTETAKTSKA